MRKVLFKKNWKSERGFVEKRKNKISLAPEAFLDFEMVSLLERWGNTFSSSPALWIQKDLFNSIKLGTLEEICRNDGIYIT